jgi:hypothetical protein
LFFSFQVLGLGLGSWRLEGRFFFQVVFSVESGLSKWTLDIELSMQVLLGAVGGAGGEDLFSFQSIGGPKVLRFYSF